MNILCKPLFHRNIVVKIRQLFLTDDVVLIQPLNDFSLANFKQDAFRIQFGSINKICRSVSSSIVGIELQAAILICRVLRISNSSGISICTVDNLNIARNLHICDTHLFAQCCNFLRRINELHIKLTLNCFF